MAEADCYQTKPNHTKPNQIIILQSNGPEIRNVGL